MEPRAAARSAIGPLMVGLAAWCALGEMSVLTPDDPSIRLAVPAEWYWFPAAALAAALVPGWRQRPLTATPALLATLPWWPVAMPALALVWSGAMAWFAILLAGIAAFVRVGSGPHSPSPGRPSIQAAIAAAGLTVVVAMFASWSLSPRLPGGDEPHYLIITQSLLQDGDIQIENNHTARDFAAYYSGEARPDFKIRGQERRDLLDPCARDVDRRAAGVCRVRVSRRPGHDRAARRAGERAHVVRRMARDR